VPIKANGTAVEVGYTLPDEATGLGLVPLDPGTVPVLDRYGAVFARPNGVSRAGKVGCGWFRYRVTMTKGFGWLKC